MEIIIKAKIEKDIPEEQIEKFEDRLVFYTAVLTREMTKGEKAYPHLTGELERQEIRTPIKALSEKAHWGLLSGTEYASYVYKMTDVKWTNPTTAPQWYSTIYRRREKTIIDTAKQRALGELNE